MEALSFLYVSRKSARQGATQASSFVERRPKMREVRGEGMCARGKAACGVFASWYMLRGIASRHVTLGERGRGEGRRGGGGGRTDL